MSGYQGNPLNPYAIASPWQSYGSNMLTPWANNWGWNYNPGAVSDWSANAGASPQWLGYQTLQQFMPQQQWQPQGQWQGQQQQPGGYPSQQQNGAQQPPQGQQQQQPQGPSPNQQLQMAMYWAGIGRPNYGGAGPGGDQGAAGQGY